MRISFRGWIWILCTGLCVATWWLVIQGLMILWTKTFGETGCAHITDKASLEASHTGAQPQKPCAASRP
ncbi:hypothetical protein MMA231_02919 [Asticcacaulis sp. MM231]